MALPEFRVSHTFTQQIRQFASWVNTNFQDVQRWLRKTSEATAFAKTASQSVPSSTHTAVSFASGGEWFDDAGWWDSGSPTRYTFSEDCRARFTGEVQFSGNASGGRYVWVRLNGSTRIASVRVPPTSASLSTIVQVSGVREFDAGDYVELMVWQDSGSTLQVQASSTTTCFWAERIK